MIKDTEWSRTGTIFAPRSRADKTDNLPSGIFEFVQTPEGWYLNKTQNLFEFSFKVYGGNDKIIDRILKFWDVNQGVLGVSFTGLKGSGKSMVVQILANKLIKEKSAPILVVRRPIPLQAVFDFVKQDIVIIFDEFEKTHDKDEQQALLSTIDGMSRSVYNRLILFTTNILTVDDNFKDRPSRIHYQFEFKKVSDEIIEGLIDDSLPEDLHHFKNEIFEFLHSRSICTIDIVKAVIAEVKTFKESPRQFEDMLNISKGEPPSFTIKIIEPTTNRELKTICSGFKTDTHYPNQGALFNGNTRAITKFKDDLRQVNCYYRGWDGNYIVNLLEKCEEDRCWLAELAVPKDKTLFADFKTLYDATDSIFLDNRPKNWEFNFTPESVAKNKTQHKQLKALWEKTQDTNTLYGSGKREVFKILIEPNLSVTPSSQYKATGQYVED